MNSKEKFNPAILAILALILLLLALWLPRLKTTNISQFGSPSTQTGKLVYWDDRIKIFYCGIEEGEVYRATEYGFDWLLMQGVKLRIVNTSASAYFVSNYSAIVFDETEIPSIPCSYRVFADAQIEELYYIESSEHILPSSITMSLTIHDIQEPKAFDDYRVEFTVNP